MQDMEYIIEQISQYGAMGLMLLACFWYINKKDMIHREERKELIASLERHHEEALLVTKANTEAMSELTSVIKNK